MDKASVPHALTVTDATCLEFLDLILSSGSLAAGSRSDWFVQRLNGLRDSDTALAGWLSKCLDSELQSDSATGDDRLAAWLPELTLPHLPTFPCTQPRFTDLLSNAAHLVVRARSFSASVNRHLETSKTEAIYHFAYGLSHEINNPLASIATRAGVLLQKHPTAADRDLLQSIVNNAMRGCEMLGDLMLIARPPKLEFVHVDIQEFFLRLLADSRPWANASFGMMIVDRFEARGQMSVDPAAFREALWCLIRNALEASACCSSQIRISVESPGDDRLQVRIIDQGPGLSEEAQEHCFDPFFSGREAGRGLGLGLTKAQRIILLHQGTLQLQNLIQGGCCALVQLPLGDHNR